MLQQAATCAAAGRQPEPPPRAAGAARRARSSGRPRRPWPGLTLWLRQHKSPTARGRKESKRKRRGTRIRKKGEDMRTRDEKTGVKEMRGRSAWKLKKNASVLVLDSNRD